MNKKTKIIICILLISFVQMSTNGISAILVNIQNHFPAVPTSLVQLLMTFPSLFIILFTMISAYLLRYFSKKKLIEVGLFLVCCAGVLSYFCYNSLLLLFVGAGLLGSGTGLCASFAISLISDYFAANERQKIMGWQTAASNLGSMIMTFAGGLLALISRQSNYIVYFIALPGLLTTHFWLDDRKVDQQQGGSIKDCGYSLRLCLLIILFMVFFYIGPTSIALSLAEKGFSDPSLAGTGSTLFLLGGTLCAMCFGKFHQYLQTYCIATGFLLLAIGLFGMAIATALSVFYLFCFIAGSSISLVMPKCMLLISLNEKKESVSLATALAMSASNVGTLIAPGFTVICGALNQTLTTQRLYLACMLCSLIFVIMVILNIVGGRKNER